MLDTSDLFHLFLHLLVFNGVTLEVSIGAEKR